MSYFWIYRPPLGNCVSSAGRSSPRLCPGSGSLLHARAAFLVGTSRWALRQPMGGSNDDGSPVGINRGNAAQTPTGFLEIVGAFFAPRWDVILRLKNSGTALSGMTLRLPLDVGSGWDVGSSIRSGWGTAFRVFRRLQIVKNLHPNHVFL